MVLDAARSLWAEPRAPDPPVRVWRDWALVAVLVPAAVLEAVIRPELVWRPVSLLLCVGLVPTLLWRRTHPFGMVAVAFGALAAVGLASIVSSAQWEGLSTGAFVLLLLYALFRWGAGREAAIGLAIVLVPVLFSAFDDALSSGDAVGAGLVVMFTSALGAAVRYQANARLRAMDQVKLREREQLARELHDTVAHHVSAIAVQAQAGRSVAASHPDAAVNTLGVIEDEASRTLAEMRTMVGSLRQGANPDLAPQPGVADIERLASTTGNGPRIDVELSGDLDGLLPAIDAALYRLAQESITNALRHARHATRIRVRVSGDDHCLKLTIGDDGNAVPAGTRSSSGYGLVGMSERAKLLGGSLEAGPNRHRGWTVSAILPRNGTAS